MGWAAGKGRGVGRSGVSEGEGAGWTGWAGNWVLGRLGRKGKGVAGWAKAELRWVLGPVWVSSFLSSFSLSFFKLNSNYLNSRGFEFKPYNTQVKPCTSMNAQTC